MAPYAKPLPVADRDTQPFWEFCKQHELRAQRCTACGAFRWPPRSFCPKCCSAECEWVRLSGRGSVYSFSVVHHAVVQAFADDVPYVVALVTLDGASDQAPLLSNIVDCPWDVVRVGMPVQVVFDDVTPEVTLLKFEPLR